VAITPGTGALAETYLKAGGTVAQVVREQRASAVASPASWTVTTTGASSVVLADDTRVYLELANTSSGRVYLRFDATTPTTSVYHTWIEPNERREISIQLAHREVSMVGETATGVVVILEGEAN
jgi:hypothetical protein